MCATFIYLCGIKEVCHRGGCASWQGKLCSPSTITLPPPQETQYTAASSAKKMKNKGGRPCRYDKNIDKVSSFLTSLSKQFWNGFYISSWLHLPTRENQKSSLTEINTFQSIERVYLPLKCFFQKFYLQFTMALEKVLEIYYTQGHADILFRKSLLAIFRVAGIFSLVWWWVLARNKIIVAVNIVGRQEFARPCRCKFCLRP